MIDAEVIAAAEKAAKAGTIKDWIASLQERTAGNTAFDKWEAAANVAQDVLEAGGGWNELLERLRA